MIPVSCGMCYTRLVNKMDLVNIEQSILGILKSQGYDNPSLTTSSVPCELYNLSLKDDSKLLTRLSEHVGFDLNSRMGHLFTSFTPLPGREYFYSVHEAAIIVQKYLPQSYKIVVSDYLNGLVIVNVRSQYYIVTHSYSKFVGKRRTREDRYIDIDFDNLEDLANNNGKVYIPEFAIIRTKVVLPGKQMQYAGLINEDIFGCWLMQDNPRLAVEHNVVRNGVTQFLKRAFEIGLRAL